MEDADVVIDAINTLLGFLPEEWKPRAQAILALLSAGSGILALWRPFIAYVAPKLAGSAPYVAIDRLLDYVVMNSRRVEVRPRVLKARLSSPPPAPKRKSGPPFGFILCLAFLPLLGCAGTDEARARGALDAAMQVADLSHEVASDACDQRGAPAKCEAIDVAYERIADIGEAALHALDEGRIEQARDMYAQIGALLRGLKR
jgi:hypothetical protein